MGKFRTAIFNLRIQHLQRERESVCVPSAVNSRQYTHVNNAYTKHLAARVHAHAYEIPQMIYHTSRVFASAHALACKSADAPETAPREFASVRSVYYTNYYSYFALSRVRASVLLMRPRQVSVRAPAPSSTSSQRILSSATDTKELAACTRTAYIAQPVILAHLLWLLPRLMVCRLHSVRVKFRAILWRKTHDASRHHGITASRHQVHTRATIQSHTLTLLHFALW